MTGAVLPSDLVEIRGIRAFGHHGVFGRERAEGQEFVVDVRLEIDTRPAAASDRLADTVDYGRIAVGVRSLVEGQPVDLLETLAERIAAWCLADRRIAGVAVSVHKPSAAIAVPFDDVVLTIHRRTDPAEHVAEHPAEHGEAL